MSHILLHQIIIYFAYFIPGVKINPRRGANKYALGVASERCEPLTCGVYLLYKYMQYVLNCKIAGWQGDSVN
jgi:hypothetical protein